jgi:hypothetical protein
VKKLSFFNSCQRQYLNELIKSFLNIEALTHYVQRESWQVRDMHEGVAQPILVNSQLKIGPRPCLPNTVLDPWI